MCVDIFRGRFAGCCGNKALDNITRMSYTWPLPTQRLPDARSVETPTAAEPPTPGMLGGGRPRSVYVCGQYTTDVRFDDRVAIVTGAGGGLGRAHALLLASRGAQVVVNDLGGHVDGSGGSLGPAMDVVAQIERAGGIAVANCNSVTTAEGGEAIVQTALDNFGRIDIVVNNAGILRDKSFPNMTPDHVEPVLDVHLRGAMNVTRPAYGVMKVLGYGRIVNTTSAAGLFGNFGQTNYGAAKAGLVGMVRVLAIEGARHGIKANAIAPVARTRMTEKILGEFADRLDPELVSPTVAWLCHEDGLVSGEVYSAGGGRVARVFTAATPDGSVRCIRLSRCAIISTRSAMSMATRSPHRPTTNSPCWCRTSPEPPRHSQEMRDPSAEHVLPATVLAHVAA